jgi:hypothetical protein
MMGGDVIERGVVGRQGARFPRNAKPRAVSWYVEHESAYPKIDDYHYNMLTMSITFQLIRVLLLRFPSVLALSPHIWAATALVMLCLAGRIVTDMAKSNHALDSGSVSSLTKEFHCFDVNLDIQ